VFIEPGAREPEHTHRQPSVMVVDRPARIRYYARGLLKFESEVEPGRSQPTTSWMEPERPHSVENIDDHRYHAIRVEFLTSDPKIGMFIVG
jgi:hypothetical protein